MLKPDFFYRDTRLVAKELLGKVLYRKIDGRIFRGIISETEAYHGTDDLACHCSKGKTARTEIMFAGGGKMYIYLIYGMYDMLNFTTMPEGFPAAVLIRGLMHAEYFSEKQWQALSRPTDGPGKLTKQFRITRDLNARNIHPDSGLWVADENIRPSEILQTPRIGVDYAGEWKHRPWRYVIKKL
jgi:DNA-3-methyladenine glycosylase